MYGFHDVYALDPEVWLTAIPQPVAAVVLLYQIKKQHNDMIKGQLEQQQKEATLKEGGPTSAENKPMFVKQTIGNACGTIALLHAVCNNVDKVGGVKEDSFLEKFMHIP